MVIIAERHALKRLVFLLFICKHLNCENSYIDTEEISRFPNRIQWKGVPTKYISKHVGFCFEYANTGSVQDIGNVMVPEFRVPIEVSGFRTALSLYSFQISNQYSQNS